MNVVPDAYLLVAVEAAAIHHNQKERAAPNYTPGLGFPKYRRWPLWFLTPALFDCGAPLTGSRRLFKPHGAFYARDTERNRVHCRDRGLMWCYAPIALYFHHCNESNSVAVFPHFSACLSRLSERFLNNCRVVSASLMLQSLIKGKLMVNDFCLKKVKLIGDAR